MPGPQFSSGTWEVIAMGLPIPYVKAKLAEAKARETGDGAKEAVSNLTNKFSK